MEKNNEILSILLKFSQNEIPILPNKDELFNKLAEIKNSELRNSNRISIKEINRILEALQRAVISSLSTQELKDRIKRLLSREFIEYFEL